MRNTACEDLPNIWGQGQLLAFSGMDGNTDWDGQLVLHTAVKPCSFDLLLPTRVHIAFDRVDVDSFSCILGDCIIADGNVFTLTFIDSNTIVGLMPTAAELRINGQPVSSTAVQVARRGSTRVWSVCEGRRWALFTTDDMPSVAVEQRVAELLHTDIASHAAARQAFVRAIELPEHMSQSRRLLVRKAASVAKVNVMSPCLGIKRMWTTPDRWPHRYMWLWDSAFQAVGLSYIAPDVAADAILAILDHVQDDGFLPHTVDPAGELQSTVTQPPILAWAVELVAARCGGRDLILQAVGRLQAYLDWNLKHRDPRRDGLLEWAIEGDPLCRSGESGMDNSPRFDRATALGAVDFTSLLANDYACLARLYAQLGDFKESDICNARFAYLAGRVEAMLWDDEAGFYFDRYPDGRLSSVMASSGFLPMFAGICSPDRARRLAQHLEDASTFGSPFGVPSVALKEGTYCKDMWRGPSWININWMIAIGLERYGFTEKSRWLKQHTLAGLEKWYFRTGSLFEYYDSLDITSPRDLDRKQRLALGEGIAAISDYHWTASATIAMSLGHSEQSSAVHRNGHNLPVSAQAHC